MSNDKHYHPAVAQRLHAFVSLHDWTGLIPYLESLSNSQFRTAGYMLGEHYAPLMAENDLWEMTIALVERNAKAFLGTMLKAISQGLTEDRLHLHSNGAKAFLSLVAQQPVDRQKALQALLPVVSKPEDVNWLFRRMAVDDGEPRLPYLMRINTLPAGYALFRSTKYVDHNRPLLLRLTYFLMKRGDALGFNLASLLRTTYGLDEVSGVFSLRIEPYQLARIENSYKAFCEAMRR